MVQQREEKKDQSSPRSGAQIGPNVEVLGAGIDVQPMGTENPFPSAA